MIFALRHTTCLHLTSSNDQSYVPGMITSLRSKYMTSGYHDGRLITSWRKRAYPSGDPEGGQGVQTPPPPPGKSQVIWVSIANKQLDPQEKVGPPWKMLDPLWNLEKL